MREKYEYSLGKAKRQELWELCPYTQGEYYIHQPHTTRIKHYLPLLTFLFFKTIKIWSLKLLKNIWFYHGVEMSAANVTTICPPHKRNPVSESYTVCTSRNLFYTDVLLTRKRGRGWVVNYSSSVVLRIRIGDLVLFTPWIREPDPEWIFSGSRITDHGSRGYVFWWDFLKNPCSFIFY
jgi:hypothetical protein